MAKGRYYSAVQYSLLHEALESAVLNSSVGVVVPTHMLSIHEYIRNSALICHG